MKTFLIFAWTIMSSLFAFAGFDSKLPVKFGRISTSEFSVKPVGNDSAASAIVLCDFGDMEITNRTFYTRHTRIKILNEEGLRYASVEIPYRKWNRHDVFIKLKAQTLVLENGKIRKFKVSASDIEDIRINDQWHIKKFTFPKATPGAIVEFEYEIASLDFEKLDTWYFQREIPTIWSEIRVDIPSPFVYLVSYENNRQLAPDEEAVYGEKLQWMYTTRERKRRFDLQKENQLLFNTSENRYKVWAINDMRKKIVMKNLPGLSQALGNQPVSCHYPQVRFDLFESSGNLPRAFRPLLLTTHKDYETKGEYAMMRDHSQFIGYVHYRLKTWSEFNEALLSDERFGYYLLKGAGSLAQNGKVNEQADELNKINAVYNYVKSSFSWNGEYAAIAAQDFKSFLEKRSGSSAEMNLIFINLLRQHGIKSDPVLIRTTNLGLPEKMYPVKNQFNHVIAAAEVNGETFLFDVTSDSEELNRLNKMDIGTEGWLVRKENPGWIETYPKNQPADEIPVFNM